MNGKAPYLVVSCVALAALCTVLLWALPARGAPQAEASELDPSTVSWGLVAAAGATMASSLGAAFAVAKVGSAAVGAIVEKQEVFGRMIVLVGLAEGIAIYGLIVSILILNRVG